jgi:hypothetical protein
MTLSAWITFPMIIIAGTVLLISLISTAALGFMIMKGKGDIPLPWHINFARMTIVIAFIHGFLAIAWYLG